MRYGKDKYKIIVHQHPQYDGTEIIAMSTYAGKVVKGKAVCHTDDIAKYDEAKGIDLAIARCANRIAAKRVKRAEKKMAEAIRLEKQAHAHTVKMMQYYNDSVVEQDETVKAMHEAYKNLG